MTDHLPADMQAVIAEGGALKHVRRPLPAPAAGEVLVRVAAAGVNRADLLQAKGLYPPPPGASDVLGLECAGTVMALGEGVSGLSIGAGVAALLAGGAYAGYVSVPVGQLLPVPSGLGFAEAASLPEAHCTVWTNIVETGRLKQGDVVLVHGGASGIGVAAIQLVAAMGHTVIVTCSGEKREACRALGAHHAIDYRTEDFVAAVKAATGGHGADVILDMVGGDYIHRNIDCAAPGGRIVNIAYQRGVKAEVNFAPVMLKRLTLAATTLRARPVPEKSRIVEAVRTGVWPMVASGAIRPVIDSAFPLAEAAAAHARMAEGRHIGKIVLTVD